MEPFSLFFLECLVVRTHILELPPKINKYYTYTLSSFFPRISQKGQQRRRNQFQITKLAYYFTDTMLESKIDNVFWWVQIIKLQINQMCIRGTTV